MRYTFIELERLWIDNGGPEQVAPVAAAIALAESGGNPRAHNSSGASGLWQILGQVEPGNIYDPNVNARNAVRKYKDAGGFSPWVTYETGEYKKYLQSGSQAGLPILETLNPKNWIGPGGPFGLLKKEGERVGEIPGAIHSTAEFAEHAGNLLLTEQGWVRIGKTIGGAILLLWGLRVVVRQSTGADPVNTATQTAGKIAAAATVVK